jgi:hypothetical protein
MSDLSMQGNPHYGIAELIIQHVEGEPGAWYDNDSEAIDRAQVKATLALAFEQRTANLIAAYQAEVTGYGRIKGDGIAIDRHNEILGRLGL